MNERRGITVIELLVAIACVALLAAIAVPAIHRARAASRLVQCKDNLKQIGVASQNFTSTQKHYPRRLMDLLPYVEQTSLHKRLMAFESELETKGALVLPEGLGSVSIFACPSDKVLLSRQKVSYFLNDGTHFRDVYVGYHPKADGIAPAFQKEQGSRPWMKKTLVAHVTDGLSNTAMFSERLQFSRETFGGQIVPSRRFAWKLPGAPANKSELLELYEQENEWIAAATPSEFRQRRSHLLNDTSYRFWGVYDHILSPNRRPVYTDRLQSTGAPNPRPSTRPATSLHEGGVNTLFCDGHVQFVSDDVDLAVWQAVGTRDGKETTHSVLVGN